MAVMPQCAMPTGSRTKFARCRGIRRMCSLLHAKILPRQNIEFCWDRINNSCGATRLGTETVPTQRVPTYAGLCLRSAFSVSHTRTVVLSVRPQESIQLYVTCRDLTARGSL